MIFFFKYICDENVSQYQINVKVDRYTSSRSDNMLRQSKETIPFLSTDILVSQFSSKAEISKHRTCSHRLRCFRLPKTSERAIMFAEWLPSRTAVKYERNRRKANYSIENNRTHRQPILTARSWKISSSSIFHVRATNAVGNTLSYISRIVSPSR